MFVNIANVFDLTGGVVRPVRIYICHKKKQIQNPTFKYHTKYIVNSKMRGELIFAKTSSKVPPPRQLFKCKCIEIHFNFNTGPSKDQKV